jgi:GxxExxY protein
MEEDGSGYDLGGQIIGLAMKVHSALGAGFLEAVYRNALALEVRREGHRVELEKPITVYYTREAVGFYLADIVVDAGLIVEVKAVRALAKMHEVQLVNYLAATKTDEGLLLNFGSSRLEFKKKFRLPKSEPASF